MTLKTSPKLLLRPISPHLTIYQPQLTSVLSIYHRITGVVIGFLLLGFPIAILGETLFALNLNPSIYSFGQSVLPFLVLPIGYVILGFFVYHTLNGFRHILWDYLGKSDNLELTQVHKSAIFVLSLGVVIIFFIIGQDFSELTFLHQ